MSAVATAPVPAPAPAAPAVAEGAVKTKKFVIIDYSGELE
jgi:hypothetical protein